MNNEIIAELKKRGVDIIRFINISIFPEEQTLGFDKAILFCMVLSRQYIQKVIGNDFQIDYDNDEYLLKEQDVEDMADWLACFLKNKGYTAHSQSEKSNAKSGYIEQAYIDPGLRQGLSILPQKSIARIAGLGFIGKNNLLVTEDYGCAFVMCSVLTNAPVITDNYPVTESGCGTCDACIKACPAKALLGNEWSAEGNREDMVDVSKCSCPLRCMFLCPWTLNYANEGF